MVPPSFLLLSLGTECCPLPPIPFLSVEATLRAAFPAQPGLDPLAALHFLNPFFPLACWVFQGLRLDLIYSNFYRCIGQCGLSAHVRWARPTTEGPSPRTPAHTPPPDPQLPRLPPPLPGEASRAVLSFEVGGILSFQGASQRAIFVGGHGGEYPGTR